MNIISMILPFLAGGSFFCGAVFLLVEGQTTYALALAAWGALAGVPHLNWSTVMFRKRRTENGEQAAQAGGNRSEVAAG